MLICVIIVYFILWSVCGIQITFYLDFGKLQVIFNFQWLLYHPAPSTLLQRGNTSIYQKDIRDSKLLILARFFFFQVAPLLYTDELFTPSSLCVAECLIILFYSHLIQSITLIFIQQFPKNMDMCFPWRGKNTRR